MGQAELCESDSGHRAQNLHASKLSTLGHAWLKQKLHELSQKLQDFLDLKMDVLSTLLSTPAPGIEVGKRRKAVWGGRVI